MDKNIVQIYSLLCRGMDIGRLAYRVFYQMPDHICIVDRSSTPHVHYWQCFIPLKTGIKYAKVSDGRQD